MNFKKRIRELFSYQIIKTWISQLKVLYSFHLTILYLYLSNWYSIKIFKSNHAYLNKLYRYRKVIKEWIGINERRWTVLWSCFLCCFFLLYSYVCSSQGTCRLIIWPLCLRLISKNLCKYFIYLINWVLACQLWINFETEGKNI